MLKPSFIIAIAFALIGCESTITDGDEGGGGAAPCEDCQPAECPSSRPPEGEPCSSVGLHCEYEYWSGTGCEEQEVEVEYRCTASGWTELTTYCSEYIPECPSALPINGSYCDWEDDDAGICDYVLESACEPSDVAQADCDIDAGVWQVTMPNGSCADCFYVNGAECAAASGCRWLEPACDAAQFEPYCAPAVDCAVDACLGEEICVEVAVDDCWWELACCDGIAGVCEAPPPSKD